MIEPTDLSDSFRELSRDVFRTCRHHTLSVEAAWDAFQETFLALTRRQDELDFSADLRPWLRETARRCSLAIVRKERRRNTTVLPVDDLDSLPVSSDDIDQIGIQELLTVLCEEVAELSREDRRLLQLLYEEGRSHRDIADHLNCPGGSVHGRVTQVHDRLRRRLKRRGISIGLMLLLFLLNSSAEAAQSAISPAEKINGPVVGPVAMRTRPVVVLAGLLTLMLGILIFRNSDALSQTTAGDRPATESDLADAATPHADDSDSCSAAE